MPAIDVNSNNFEEVVMKSKKPVLIDFWASWCVPCRIQSHAVKKLGDEMEGSAVVAKLNIDESPEIAAQFSVRSIPTLIVMKDGKIVDRRTGLSTKAALLSMLKSVNA